VSELARETLHALTAGGGVLAEIFLKRGRTRRYQVGSQGGEVTLCEEQGWAVRAGTDRSSFFAAGSGMPSPAGPWPAPDGPGLRLPEPTGPARWRPPADFEAPLVGEREALVLLEGIEKRLRERLPGSRLLHGELEDGSSQAELVNSLGVRAELRRRLARLRLEVAGPGPNPVTTDLEVAEREPRRFDPPELAALAAARLAARGGGRPVPRDRGELLLAPSVAAGILVGLAPLLVGPDAGARARRYRDRRGRIGSPLLTVLDDGRLPGGLLTAPVDGEGTPTREVVLVEEGVFRQPLLAWWQGGGGHARVSGCVARPGWRDLPRPAPTHLYLRPDRHVGAAELLESIGRGYQLVDMLGPGRFDFDSDRLSVPVCGFTIRGGRAEEPLTDSWLCGGIGAFVHGVRAVASDLVFAPLGGLIGSPSILVGGFELRS
jgi:PmbA protein